MGAVGIGLGFILNNLNVFGQEIAGRERFGITTALLQSTRMVGGMLGTSIVATVVQHHYRNVVTRTMSVLGEPAASQWRPRFVDLRILIDDASRTQLIADMRLGAQYARADRYRTRCARAVDSYRCLADGGGIAGGRAAGAADLAHHVSARGDGAGSGEVTALHCQTTFRLSGKYHRPIVAVEAPRIDLACFRGVAWPDALKRNASPPRGSLGSSACPVSSRHAA